MEFSKNRIYGLDILRAVAIVSVLYTHAFYKISSHVNELIYHSFLPDGVSLFFVLSGFLIGGILIRTINNTDFNWQELIDFWIRRWFRTVPAYFLIVAILVIWDIATATYLQPISFYLKYFVFLQSVGDGNCFLYPESWSLCVEEWFYFLIPVFLFLFIRIASVDKRKAILLTIAGTIAAITLLRMYKVHLHHYSTMKMWDTLLRKALITRLDGIMYGFIGAYLMYYHPNIVRLKNRLFGAGILLFIMLGIRSLFGFGPFYNYFQLPAESVATLLLIPKLVTVRKGKGLVFQVLTFISMISYSVYLLNYTPFDLWVEPWLHRLLNIKGGDHSVSTDSLRVILFLAWSISGGYVLYHFVEKPMMRRRPGSIQKRYSKPVSLH